MRVHLEGRRCTCVYTDVWWSKITGGVHFLMTVSLQLHPRLKFSDHKLHQSLQKSNIQILSYQERLVLLYLCVEVFQM